MTASCVNSRLCWAGMHAAVVIRDAMRLDLFEEKPRRNCRADQHHADDDRRRASEQRMREITERLPNAFGLVRFVDPGLSRVEQSHFLDRATADKHRADGALEPGQSRPVVRGL